MEKCRKHHIEARGTSKPGFQHNNFTLWKGEKEIGFSSVASNILAGAINIEKK